MWNKEEITVGVLMGGLSSERAISIKSGRAVLKALQERGWNAVEIDVTSQLAHTLISHNIDVAWNALHGIYGEDGCVQGLLEVMGIPYTGSSVQACAISMDKRTTKIMLQDTLVNRIPDCVLKHGEEPSKEWYPCVLKDPLGGSSIGVWICHGEDDLRKAYTQTNSQIFLLEKFIEGEEITVAVFEGEAYPVVSIRPKEGFFDLEAKYTKGKTEYIVPSPLSADICTNAQKQAIAAYNTVGMSGIARADFIVTQNGDVYFLEINASPGMTATSLSPMAAQAVGISFPELVEKVLHTAHCNRTPHRE